MDIAFLFFLIIINSYSTNVILLYPLKTSENLRFSDIFRKYISRTLVENGLIRKIWSVTNNMLKHYFSTFTEATGVIEGVR